MDLEELRAFLAVAETGSFAAAAERLGSPRATLRRRVDELEARTNAPLLRRTRDGATLTAAGQALALRAATLLEDAGALIRCVHDVGAEPAGVVRVSLPVGLPPFVLVGAFALLRERAPKLRFEAHLSNAPLSDRLDDVDVAVHFGPIPPRSRWVTRQLTAMRVWLVASPAYLNARGRPSSPQELSSHDLLSWDGPESSGTHWPLLDGRELRVEPKVRVADVHVLRHLAAAGQGIALLPDAQLPDPDLPPGALETVLPDVVGREATMMLSVPAVLADVPRIKVFVDLAHEVTEQFR